jgi:hypothetical protein
MRNDIKLELKTMTPTRLALLVGHVADQLEGNPHLPAPPIAPAELRAREAMLTAAITEAVDGSRLSKARRNALVRKAQDDLRRLVHYVRMAAQEDRTILVSSGFPLAKPGGPPQRVGTPVLRVARPSGRHGEVELRWTAVDNRRAYQVYVSTEDPGDPEGAWTLACTTGKVTHRVQGLEPYRPYWFRVSAVGALGEGARCPPMLGRAA